MIATASEKEVIDDTAASSLIELSRSSRGGQMEQPSHRPRRRSPTQQLIKIGDNVILVEMAEDDDMDDMSASGTQQHPNNKNEFII